MEIEPRKTKQEQVDLEIKQEEVSFNFIKEECYSDTEEVSLLHSNIKKEHDKKEDTDDENQETIEFAFVKVETNWNQKEEIKPDPLALSPEEDGIQCIEGNHTTNVNSETSKNIVIPKTQTKKVTRKKIHKCPHCDYSTAYRGHIKTHVMGIHTKEKPYKCTQCEYSTCTLSHIRRHMRGHTGEKPYQCVQCDYSASFIGALKSHLKVHNGEKPYSCQLCDFSTSGRSTLKIHIMRIHTKERPYKCTFCEFRSAEKCRIKIHMRIHTGEKPYKCTLCDYKAAASGSLKLHYIRHM